MSNKLQNIVNIVNLIDYIRYYNYESLINLIKENTEGLDNDDYKLLDSIVDLINNIREYCDK